MKIHLVRHGLTPTTGSVLPGRAPGLHLSPEGRRQAADVVGRFQALDAVFSSPMERARETAAPTAARFNLDVLIDARFTECDFGSWTGLRLSELSTLPEWQTVQKQPSAFRFPDGESFVEMQARIVDGIEHLASQFSGGEVAVFSHADPIKAAKAHYQGLELDKFQSINIEPTSVTTITFVEGVGRA